MNTTTHDYHIAVIVRSDRTPDEDSIKSISELAEPADSREISKGVIKKIKTNLLVYKKVYKSCGSVDEVIKRFCDEWPNIKLVFEENGYKNEIFMRMFIMSEYAQLGHVFSPMSLGLLAQMNVPIEVSILPWNDARKI